MGKRLFRGAALAAALCLLAAAEPVGADQPEHPGPVSGAGDAVVRVSVTFRPRNGPFRLDARQAQFANVGFVAGPHGEVVTCLLGLAGCERVYVAFPDGRRIEAQISALDQASGLALLSTGVEGVRPLQTAAQDPPSGSPALLATPYEGGAGVATTLEPTVLNAYEGTVRLGGVEWTGLMAAPLHLEPGCAGAPLLSEQGRLVGVVIGAEASPDGRAARPRALVLPAERLKPALERLLRGESRRLGWLGLALAREPADGRGLAVQAVLEDSPAMAAGILAGDVLLTVDGQSLAGPAVLARRVVEAGPGRTVQIALRRGGEELTLPVGVEPRPLLICAGRRWPGDNVVRPYWRPSGAPPAGEPEPLAPLREENARLRRRLRELEDRLQALKAPQD